MCFPLLVGMGALGYRLRRFGAVSGCLVFVSIRTLLLCACFSSDGMCKVVVMLRTIYCSPAGLLCRLISRRVRWLRVWLLEGRPVLGH